MERTKYLNEIESHFRIHSVCALLGPRQVGKTTLAHMYVEQYLKNQTNHSQVQFFDLENPFDLSRLENPILTLSQLPNHLVIIDEIQRLPDLFPVLRVLVDKKSLNLKFLILGSASKELIRQSSETLAGRIGYIELMPFSLDEAHDSSKLWLRGGFPRSYLANTMEESYQWRQSYIRTFLERDIPALGFQIPPEHMRRFWLMLTHYHGQMMNYSELAKSLAVSDHTVRKYLDILVGTFMVRSLTPWYENLSKRQVKTPKVYFRDSGILHALLGIQTESDLQHYPKLGSFWEGFALEEIINQNALIPEECYFWGTQSGAELDLLVVKNGKKIGFEFKYSDRPKVTASMRTALSDLKLDHLYVIYPDQVSNVASFPLTENITACGLKHISLK